LLSLDMMFPSLFNSLVVLTTVPSFTFLLDRVDDDDDDGSSVSDDDDLFFGEVLAGVAV